MAGNRAPSIQLLQNAAPGRHRLGQAGLRHCRELDGVNERLAANRRVRRVARPGPREADLGAAHARRRAAGASAGQRTARLTAVVMAVMVTGAVVVSGWYTAAGANAIVQMVAP